MVAVEAACAGSPCLWSTMDVTVPVGAVASVWNAVAWLRLLRCVPWSHDPCVVRVWWLWRLWRRVVCTSPYKAATAEWAFTWQTCVSVCEPSSTAGIAESTRDAREGRHRRVQHTSKWWLHVGWVRRTVSPMRDVWLTRQLVTLTVCGVVAHTPQARVAEEGAYKAPAEQPQSRQPVQRHGLHVHGGHHA